MLTLVAPVIRVFAPERRGNRWRAAGTLTFGNADPIFLAASVSDAFVRSVAGALMGSGGPPPGMMANMIGADDLQSKLAAILAGLPQTGLPGMPGMPAMPSMPPAGFPMPGGLPHMPAVPHMPAIPGMGHPGGGGGGPSMGDVMGAVKMGLGFANTLGGMLGGGGSGGGGLGGLASMFGGIGAMPPLHPPFPPHMPPPPPQTGASGVPITLPDGWAPAGVAQWYTNDPNRASELLALNRIVLGSDGSPYPWGKGQILYLPASWNAGAKSPLPLLTRAVGANPGDAAAINALEDSRRGRSVLEHGGSVDGTTLRGLESRGEVRPVVPAGPGGGLYPVGHPWFAAGYPGHPLYSPWGHRPHPVYGTALPVPVYQAGYVPPVLASWGIAPGTVVGPPVVPVARPVVDAGDAQAAEAFKNNAWYRKVLEHGGTVDGSSLKGLESRGYIGADPAPDVTSAVAKALTSSAVTRSALDIAEFMPGVGALVKLARGAASMAHGVLSDHPDSKRLYDEITTSAMAGNTQAQALMTQVQEASRALCALKAAQSGDPKACATLFKIGDDAKRGVKAAVETEYLLTAARDILTPNLRDEASEAGMGEASEVSGDPSTVGALSYLTSIGADRPRRPTEGSNQWLAGVLGNLAAQQAGKVGCPY